MLNQSYRADTQTLHSIRIPALLLRSVLLMVRQKLRRRRHQKAVQHLDAHLLKDIGLDLEDVGVTAKRIRTPPAPWLYDR